MRKVFKKTSVVLAALMISSMASFTSYADEIDNGNDTATATDAEMIEL